MPTAEEFEGCWPRKVLEATSCGPVFLPVAEAASARGGLSPWHSLWLPWPTGLEPSTLEMLQEQARVEGITVERHFIQQATLTVTRSDIVKWKV